MAEKRFLSPSEIDQVFVDLCMTLRPSIICDVGTRDCEDALRLKAACPSASVFAFEASPENFFDYCCDAKVARGGVNAQQLAISDTIGVAEINIPHYASRKNGGNSQQRGTSSLLRKANTASFVTYAVPQTTIDAFFCLQNEEGSDASFAFWIDVEGFSLQVLSGMRKTLCRTRVIKIELEDFAYFENQTLSAPSRQILADCGFVEAYQTHTKEQFDIVFLRR
jgi:FkbM family methyltransferase